MRGFASDNNSGVHLLVMEYHDNLVDAYDNSMP